MYFRVKALTFKLETTYATDATPLAANIVRALNLNITPLEADVIEVDAAQPYMGAGDTLLVNARVKFDFSVAAAGSGAAGTVPAYGGLFRACGLAETISAGVSVVYNPISAAFESGTAYFYLDGDLHKITGCRGNVSLELAAKQYPVWKFTFVGKYNPVVSGSIQTINYSSYKSPVPPSKENTPTVMLMNYSCKLDMINLDAGQQVEPRTLCNDFSVDISDRKATAKMMIERPPVSVKDFWAATVVGAKGAIQLIHGTAPGNIIQIDAPAAQIVTPGTGVNGGVAMLDHSLSLKPTSGNDEFTLTIK